MEFYFGIGSFLLYPEYDIRTNYSFFPKIANQKLCLEKPKLRHYIHFTGTLLGSKERCPERLAKGADVADVNAKNNIRFTAFPLWGRGGGGR
jgi:hypothetical protein